LPMLITGNNDDSVSLEGTSSAGGTHLDTCKLADSRQFPFPR
jgi:hypothetical protein